MRNWITALLSLTLFATTATANDETRADTLARDLSELEAAMPDTIIADEPKEDYGARKHNDIDAMQFILDRRHRYRGDSFRKGASQWFLQVDGGFTAYSTQTAISLTPRQDLSLRAGYQFSPNHALRLGLGGGYGFVNEEAEKNIPKMPYTMTGKVDVDYLFSLSNYLLGYRPERPLDFSAVVGLGGQFSTISRTSGTDVYNYADYNAFSMYLRLGAQLKLFAGERTSLALEPYLLVATNPFDFSKPGDNQRDYDTGYGINLQVIYHLGSRLTPSTMAGDFKRRYKPGQRLFADDSTATFWRHPSFVDLQGGLIGQTNGAVNFGESIGPVFGVSFGYWLSSAVALRLTGGIGRYYVSESEDDKRKLKLTSVGLDAVVNPFGFRRDYDWQSPFGLNLIAGLELARTRGRLGDYQYERNGATIGPKVGVQLWGRVTDHLHLTLEPTYSWAEQFKGQNERALLEQFAIKAGAQVIIDHNLPSTLAKDYRMTRDGIFSVGRAIGNGAASAAVFVGKNVASGVSSAAVFVGKNVGNAAVAVYNSALSVGRWFGSLGDPHGASMGRRPLFVDYSYGYGMFPGMQAKASESWGSTSQASLGWWPTSWIGGRASMVVAKGSGIVQRSTDGDADHDDRKTTEFAAGALDLLFNPLGLTRNYDWNAPAGVNLIAGYQNGYYALGAINTYAKGRNKYFSSVRLGGQLWVRLSDDLRFHFEPLYSIINVENIYVNDENANVVSLSPREGYSAMAERHHLGLRFGLTLLLRTAKHREEKEGEPLNDRRWFVGATTGWNFQCRKHYYAGTGRSINGTFIAGYNFSKLSAARLSAEFLNNNVMERHGNQYSMNNLKVSLSSLCYQMNITNLFSGYQPSRRFEGVVHGGPALAIDMQETDRKYLGITGGVTLNWHINSLLALTATHSHYCFGLWDHGRVFRSNDIVGKVTVVTTFNLGLMLKL